METMTANFPPPPLTAVPPPTHLPQSQSPRAQKATRTVHTLPEHSQHHAHHHHHHHHHAPTLSAPASQESMVSVQTSYGSSLPPRHGSDSNLSTQTDLTSPSPSLGLQHILTNVPPASHDATQKPPHHVYRPRNKTPENAQQSPTHTAEHALYSPMSITSPAATNGAKRTASGHVKNAHSMHTSPSRPQFPGRESRRESLSSSGSKAGEIAATLKARLAYAMAKVQNGWEHKSLAEVEQLAAQRHRSRTSVSHIDHQRPGTSGLSNGASRLSMYDHYARTVMDLTEPPPSKRTSGNYSQYQAQVQSQLQPHPHHFASPTTTPRLQPAPDIRPTSRQSGAAYSGPILQPLPQHVSNAMSPPRTPISATSPQRPPTIRTQTQTAEAEREALQALFQLGSPHTSVGPHIPRTGTATTNSSQSQMSPARQPDPTPRHATFVRSKSASTSSSSGLDPTPSNALQESRTRLMEQLADQ